MEHIMANTDRDRILDLASELEGDDSEQRLFGLIFEAVLAYGDTYETDEVTSRDMAVYALEAAIEMVNDHYGQPVTAFHTYV